MFSKKDAVREKLVELLYVVCWELTSKFQNICCVKKKNGNLY